MRTDKDFQKLVSVFWIGTGLVLFTLISFWPGEQMSLEKLSALVCMMVGLCVFICCMLLGAIYSNDIRKAERKKNGLRRSWKAEDLDELEERVRKLEEKE